jgi:hypothetical protein
VISTELRTTARPATVHALLVDVDTWSMWSPHVASVRADARRVASGWEGTTRAFFSPIRTSMTVDEVRPDGGYDWHSTLGPWRLDYRNEVEAESDGGSRLRFSASVSGPGGRVVERVVAPLSAFGQGRRMARLARLAEFLDRR